MNENKYRLLVFIVFMFYLMNSWIIFIINSMCFSSGYIRNRNFPILFQVWFCIAMQICGINNANIANNSGVQWGKESGIPRQIYCELKFQFELVCLLVFGCCCCLFEFDIHFDLLAVFVLLLSLFDTEQMDSFTCCMSFSLYL